MLTIYNACDLQQVASLQWASGGSSVRSLMATLGIIRDTQ